MYVKRLEIENIRSFKEADIEFSEGINIIAGANNAGKSTLLKSIYLLQDPNNFREHDIRKGETNAGVRITLADISKAEGELFVNTGKNILFPVTMQFAEVYFPRSTQKLNEAYYAEMDRVYHTALKELNIQHRRERFKSSFPYFTNLENKGSFIYPFFSKRRSGFLNTGGRDSAYQVLEDLRNLPLKVLKAMGHPKFKKRFGLLCRDILGFEVAVEHDENNFAKIATYVKANDKIPLESMGEGTANILGLLILLLTENNKLFLLEELENDIHPQALKKILELIIEKSRDNQFIVSTHSNIILKYLGSQPKSKIFFSQWEYNLEEPEEAVPTSEVYEISNSAEKRLEVLEKLGYELLDSDLYKGYVIFEESSAERIIRDFIIPEYVTSLTNKVKTVASNGVDKVKSKLDALNTLFMYLNRNEIYRNRAWVIADGDDHSKQVIASIKNKYNEWDPSHFMNFEKFDFEYYYPERFSERVADVLAIKNGKERQELKKALLLDVMEWINSNKVEARKEFLISAEEVIAKLKQIEDVLNRR